MIQAIRTNRGNRRPGATTYGAIGFAVGLAAAGAIYGLITFQLRGLDTGLIGSILPLALAGAIGGGVLGLTRSTPGRMALDALAASVALGSGLLLTNLLYAALLNFNLSLDAGVLVVYLVRFALVGGFVGLLLSIVRGNWKQSPRLALQAALGFGLGAFILDRLGQLLNQPMTLLVPGSIGDPAHDGLALAITWAISFAAAGLIGGAALGHALDHT